MADPVDMSLSHRKNLFLFRFTEQCGTLGSFERVKPIITRLNMLSIPMLPVKVEFTARLFKNAKLGLKRLGGYLWPKD